MSRFSRAGQIIYVSSGTAALAVALGACKKKSKRRKVVIPAYTCPSVLAAVQRLDLEAVLCDFAPHRLDYDEEQLARAVDKDTLAVIWVHLFGLDKSAASIKRIARGAGAWLIEDAAQALGNKDDGQLLGSEGDLAVFSFGRGKPLSALHGGAVAVNQRDLASATRAAFQEMAQPLPKRFNLYYWMLLSAYCFLFHPRLFGLPKALPWFRIGETLYVERFEIHGMAPLAGKIIAGLMKDFGAIGNSRARVARRYQERLSADRDLFGYLPSYEETCSGPLRFPLVFKKGPWKNACLDALSEKGLGASCSYPVPLNEQEGVPSYVRLQGPFPIAKAVADGILTLPTHEYVTDQDVDDIAETLRRRT